MSMIDMRSVDPAMGNNRAVSSGTTRAIDAAGADYGVSFGHRGHHRAEREDSGDRGHDCSLHIKSPSKIALFEHLLPAKNIGVEKIPKRVEIGIWPALLLGILPI